MVYAARVVEGEELKGRSECRPFGFSASTYGIPIGALDKRLLCLTFCKSGHLHFVILGGNMADTKDGREAGLPRLSRTEALILSLLMGKSELYGLEMVEQSDGRLKRGTIYVTLGRMQDKGLVESRKEPRQSPEVGIPRRLYSITGYGMRVIAAYEVARENFANFAICGGFYE